MCYAGVPNSPITLAMRTLTIKATSAQERKHAGLQPAVLRRPGIYCQSSSAGAPAATPRRTWASMSAASSALARAQRPR